MACRLPDLSNTRAARGPGDLCGWLAVALDRPPWRLLPSWRRRAAVLWLAPRLLWQYRRRHGRWRADHHRPTAVSAVACRAPPPDARVAASGVAPGDKPYLTGGDHPAGPPDSARAPHA